MTAVSYGRDFSRASGDAAREAAARLTEEVREVQERERIAKLIAIDLLNAIEAIYGADGLKAVTDHARRSNRVREDNVEIDALETIFAQR